MILLLLGCRLVDDADDGACPPWSGLVEQGQGWVYEQFADGAQSIVVLSSLGDDAATVSAGTWTETYACDDDGAWLVDRHEAVDAWTARWTFDPPFLAVPRRLEPGDAWTADRAWRYVDSDGNEEISSSKVQYEATRYTETWVPAGSWETIEVHLHDEDGHDDVQFWARGVGLVLGNDVQLVQFGDE